MILYIKTGCPYCAKVLAVLEEHKLPFEEKNIADAENVATLIEHGGKRQVPYLIDGDVALYESDDIVAYLTEKAGGQTA